MTNIKYFLYSISRKKTFFVMSIFQITLCLVLTFSVYIDYIYSFDSYNISKKIYDNKNVYKVVKTSIPDKPITKEMFNEFLTDMGSINNVEYVSLSPGIINAKYMDKLKSFIVKGQENAPDFKGQKMAILNSVKINNAFINTMEFPLLQGNWNSVLKYNSDVNKNTELVPVVLGNSYSKVFKVGDTLEYLNTNSKGFGRLLVTGILQKDIIYSDGEPGQSINLDNFICYPIIPSKITNASVDQEMQIQNYLDNNVVVKSDFEKFKTKIKSAAKSLGYRISIIDLNEQIKKGLYNLNHVIYENKILAYIAAIFSVISISLALYSNIIKNYREFGIHILLGCKKSDIYKRILYEIFFMTAISVFITINITKIMYKNMVNYKYIDSSIYILIILAVLFSIVVSIVPILKVRSLKLNSTIRGDE